jgi:hypothetical protein
MALVKPLSGQELNGKLSGPARPPFPALLMAANLGDWP